MLEAAHKIAADIGAKVDSREGQTPGAKFYHWERRGVPLVLELGPRDLASGNIVLKRRDTGTKEILPQTEIAAKVPAVLEQMQADLYAAAKKRLKDEHRARQLHSARWKTSCAQSPPRRAAANS